MPKRAVHGGGPGPRGVPARHRRSASDGFRLQRGARPCQLPLARESPAAGGGQPRQRRVHGMTARSRAWAVAAVAALVLGAAPALVLGAVPALAASSNPYDAFDQTAFLAYLNAPEAGADLTR